MFFLLLGTVWTLLHHQSILGDWQLESNFILKLKRNVKFKFKKFFRCVEGTEQIGLHKEPNASNQPNNWLLGTWKLWRVCVDVKKRLKNVLKLRAPEDIEGRFQLIYLKRRAIELKLIWNIHKHCALLRHYSARFYQTETVVFLESEVNMCRCQLIIRKAFHTNVKVSLFHCRTNQTLAFCSKHRDYPLESM